VSEIFLAMVIKARRDVACLICGASDTKYVNFILDYILIPSGTSSDAVVVVFAHRIVSRSTRSVLLALIQRIKVNLTHPDELFGLITMIYHSKTPKCCQKSSLTVYPEIKISSCDYQIH